MLSLTKTKSKTYKFVLIMAPDTVKKLEIFSSLLFMQ
jgi:hypothetical protein